MASSEEIIPQITLTGSGADLDPAAVLGHALLQYQAGVRAEAEKRVLAASVDLSADVLSAILMEVAGGHLNLFRLTAGVAFRVAIKRSRARAQLAISETEAARLADDAAMNLGAYLAATSSNAVMDGYHLNVNAKVPPKEAARRATRAFGLTLPQMRSVFKLRDEGVASAQPGAWRNLIDAFVRRAFGQRIEAIVDNSLRQVEADAVQRGWEEGLANGTIPETATKVWFTALDERTCPVCAPMDKVAVSILDTFHLPDGNRVKSPPVHVNCRCTLELAYDPEEISKAHRWDERLHPRSENGEFAFKVKTKPDDAQARANVDRLLANLNLNQVGPDSVRLGAAGPAMGAGPRAASGPQAAPNLGVHSPAAAATPGAAAPEGAAQIRTHVVLGGKEVNLRRLNMAHQMQVAATIAANAEHQVAPLPPKAVSPIPNRYVAFAAPVDLNVQRYHGKVDRAGNFEGDGGGVAQIERPLRFVDRNDRAAVRVELDKAMEAMDVMFRETPYDETLDTMGHHRDPGVVEAAADLRMDILAKGRDPKGQVRVAVAPEDASEAWRNVLSPDGSGYRMLYVLEAHDETGRTVGKAHVSAPTIVALSQTQDVYRPHAVVAPFGGWRTEDGHGATTTVPGTDHIDVTGPFSFERIRGVLVLTPDPDVYGRAHPEFKRGT